MEPSLYQIGPFVMRVTNLPKAWHDHVQASFASADDNTTDAPLHLHLRTEGAPDRGDGSGFLVNMQHIRVERDQERWTIFHEDAFTANYSPDTDRIDLDVRHNQDAPRVILDNTLRGVVATMLPLRFHGLMLHASSGLLNHHGIFFAGLSTAGKTTMAEGMKRAQFLSDDISLVRDLSTTPELMASPFYGALGRRGADASGPLRAVVLLEKDPSETRITPVDPRQAVMELLRHVVCFSKDSVLSDAILTRVTQLVERVPVFRVARFIETASDDICQQVLDLAAADPRFQPK